MPQISRFSPHFIFVADNYIPHLIQPYANQSISTGNKLENSVF